MTATNSITTAATSAPAATTANAATATPRRPRISAAIAGILLALLITQPAAAATWSGDPQLTATSNSQPRILRSGATSAISIWQSGQNVSARRTPNVGTTWAPQQTLVSGIWF